MDENDRAALVKKMQQAKAQIDAIKALAVEHNALANSMPWYNIYKDSTLTASKQKVLGEMDTFSKLMRTTLAHELYQAVNNGALEGDDLALAKSIQANFENFNAILEKNEVKTNISAEQGLPEEINLDNLSYYPQDKVPPLQNLPTPLQSGYSELTQLQIGLQAAIKQLEYLERGINRVAQLTTSDTARRSVQSWQTALDAAKQQFETDRQAFEAKYKQVEKLRSYPHEKTSPALDKKIERMHSFREKLNSVAQRFNTVGTQISASIAATPEPPKSR